MPKAQEETPLIQEEPNYIHKNLRELVTKQRVIDVARAISAEFIGTVLLIFIGCGTSISQFGPETSTVIYALNFGGLVAALIFSLEIHSGAVFNPAVTLSLILVREISIARGLLYMLMQVLGAIVGSYLLKGIISEQLKPQFIGITTQLAKEVSPSQGCVIEMILTFFLCTVVLFVCVSPAQPKERKQMAPFVVGGTIVANILFGGPLTGASMNPARTFGPALANGYWDVRFSQLNNDQNQWVYWVGPFIGSMLASGYYALHDTSYFFRKNGKRW